MTINQISVFLENKSGRIAEVTRVLAEAGINLRAMTIADTADFGILRIIANNYEKAREVLEANEFTTRVTRVLGIEVSDEPGGLYKIMKLFKDNGVNIEYLYAFLSSSGQGAYVVLRVADNAAAEKTLTDAGYNILADEDAID